VPCLSSLEMSHYKALYKSTDTLFHYDGHQVTFCPAIPGPADKDQTVFLRVTNKYTARLCCGPVFVRPSVAPRYCIPLPGNQCLILYSYYTRLLILALCRPMSFACLRHMLPHTFPFFLNLFVMAALWNRTGHYIFIMWFLLLSSFFLA